MKKPIEKKLPFAECHLWKEQGRFYQSNGIEAWNNLLPFYATNNPYIGKAYAEVILRYMQDLVRLKLHDNSEPIYILELGAGTGAFCYYLLKTLVDLQPQLNLGDVKFIYVMCDFATKNIDFWQTQPNLLPYIEQGYLDFAFFDADQQQDIQLQKSGILLQKDNLKNPLIVIANYFFDSCRHDFFRIQDKKLQIALFDPELKLPTDINNSVVAMAEIDPSFEYVDIQLPYYQDQMADSVLQYYLSHFDNINFTFPIGVIHCIEHLRKMANNRLLLLCTDKGYAKFNIEYAEAYQPDVVPHAGAFSISVNFHALGQYAKQCAGDFHFEDTCQDLTSVLCTFGDNLIEFIETRQAAMNYLNRFSPSNTLQLISQLKHNGKQFHLNTILAFLKYTDCDNYIFLRFLPVILELIKKYPHNILAIQDLLDHLDKIAENFYYLPAVEDTFFGIASLLQILQRYESALQYYGQSLNYFGRLPNTLFSMAICYYFLDNREQALAFFKEANKLDNENILITGWLNFIISNN
jgi:tetratricopeptide (TPR) repeat protein